MWEAFKEVWPKIFLIATLFTFFLIAYGLCVRIVLKNKEINSDDCKRDLARRLKDRILNSKKRKL